MAVSDVAKSVIGMVEKAKLIIHETSGAEKLNSQKVSETTIGMLSGASSPTAGANLRSHAMTVQYNPSSLTIQANAEAIPFKYLQANVDEGVPNQNLRPPQVVLSVELIFDDMNTQDAFMMDRMRLSADALIQDGAAIAKEFKGGYTVQPQTNALLATLMRANTKTVTFAWADMAFTGQVIEVEAQYTMFSPSGRPVRSMVHLNIAQQVESQADSDYWEKAMDKTFEKNGVFSGKGLGQKVGNILNLDSF